MTANAAAIGAGEMRKFATKTAKILSDCYRRGGRADGEVQTVLIDRAVLSSRRRDLVRPAVA